MSLKAVSSHEIRQYLDQGAILVDIRSADEYTREHITEARHIPLEQLATDKTAQAKMTSALSSPQRLASGWVFRMAFTSIRMPRIAQWQMARQNTRSAWLKAVSYRSPFTTTWKSHRSAALQHPTCAPLQS